MVRLCLIALLGACGGSAARPEAARPEAPPPDPSIVLDASLVADRFFVEARTAGGGKIRFYTDTGGGMFVLQSAAERLKLPPGPEENTVKLELAPGETLPLPAEPMRTFPDAEAHMLDADGMLGQAWFGGRTWTFDYARGRLLLRQPGDLPPHQPSQRVPLAFKPEHHFPRMEISVDGQPIDVLFDTGAMVRLTDEAVAALGEPRARATSFITRTIFEGWRERHPDWRVIETADANARGAPMIEGPAVTIAGETVGPVWFTRRNDNNFRVWMAQWMDRPIDGAIGGSGLRYFRISADYPSAVAVFERVK